MTDNKTYNIQSIGKANFFVETTSGFDLPESISFRSPWHRIWNYIKTTFFLVAVFFVWLITGLFVNVAFPKKLATDLICYSWSGFLARNSSNDFWENLKSSLQSLSSLPEIERTTDIDEAKKLNSQDSYYWLLSQLLQILEDDINDSENIFWQIRSLEAEREKISIRLDPLKNQYLGGLKNLQKLSNKLNLFSKKSAQYDQVNSVLKKLIHTYISEDKPSELEIQYLIEALESSIPSVSGSQSLYNIFKIVNWVNSHSFNSSQTNYEDVDKSYPKIRAYKSHPKTKYHITSDCPHYPRIEKEEDINKIQGYLSIEEAEQDGRSICSICKKISQES